VDGFKVVFAPVAAPDHGVAAGFGVFECAAHVNGCSLLGVRIQVCMRSWCCAVRGFSFEAFLGVIRSQAR
jgi:hypothetical protein